MVLSEQYVGQWVTVSWVPTGMVMHPANQMTRTGILRKDPDFPNMYHLRAKKNEFGRNHMIDGRFIVSITLLKFEEEEEETGGIEFTPGDEVEVD